jgi:hypothetical protein
MLLLSLLSIDTKAQLSIGMEAGGNKNFLFTNNQSQSFSVYKGVNGVSFGIPVLYKFNDWFSLQADPSYIKKNYKTERTDFFEGVYQTNINSYLQLPVSARFSFGGKQVKGFINLGAYAAYWTAGKVKGAEANILDPVDSAYAMVNPANIFGENKAYNYNEKYAFNNTRDNRLELGLVAGLGISYDITERWQLFAEGRYTYSLTDQQKNYMLKQVARYNDTYGISVGCLFSLQSIFNNNDR